MDANLIFVQVLAGISTGALYFLVASGLTLVWGSLGVINLAHGSFFMVAAYATAGCVFLAGEGPGLLLALIVVPIGIVVLAVAIEVLLFRRVYSSGIWGQLLVSFGLLLVLNDILRATLGALPHSVAPPDILRGYIEFGGVRLAIYPLAVIFITCLVAVFMWYMLSRCRIGKLIRAAVDDPVVLTSQGIDVARLRTKVFCIAAVLAAIAGVVAAPRGAINTTMDVQMIVIAFAIIIVGGLGSVWGALAAAMLIGIAEALSTLVIDQGSEVVIFVIMAVILAVRPTGLRTIAGRAE